MPYQNILFLVVAKINFVITVIDFLPTNTSLVMGSAALDLDGAPDATGLTPLEKQVFDRLNDETLNRLSMNNPVGPLTQPAPNRMTTFPLPQFPHIQRALCHGTPSCQ